MLDVVIYFLFSRTYIFIALLFAVKIYLFITSEHRSRSFSKFFYYTHTNMVLTTNPKRYRYKRIQNKLTLAILVLALVQVIFLGILYSVFM